MHPTSVIPRFSFLPSVNLPSLFTNVRLSLVTKIALAIIVYVAVVVALRRPSSISYLNQIIPPTSPPSIPSSRNGIVESISENLSIPNGQVLLTTKPGSDINDIIMSLCHQRSSTQFFVLNTEHIIENYAFRPMIHLFNDLISSLPSHPVLVIYDFHDLLSKIETSSTAKNLWAAIKRNIKQGSIQCIAIITEKGRTSLAKDDTCLELFNDVSLPSLNVETCTSWLLQIKTQYETKYGCTFTEEAIKKAVKLADSYVQNKVLPGSALDILESASRKAKERSLKTVEDSIIAEVVSKRNNIPLGQLESERNRITHLQKTLENSLFGQNEAIEAVIQAFKLRLFYNGIPKKPIGSFLFVGPTGTGKTLLAHQIAKYVFNDENAVLRIDMSNLVQSHCISTLIGVPPGYVGHNTDSHLTRKVETTPRCVVIFDEAEKAHHQILNIFLRLLETGYMTDANGRAVDFRETFVIATSNLGSNLDSQTTYDTLKQNAAEALRDRLPPEILNRFDHILVFRPLSEDMIENIIRQGVRDKIDALNKGSTNITIDESVVSFLKEQNKDHTRGARPISQSIDNLVISPLIDYLIESPDKITVSVSAINGKIIIS